MFICCILLCVFVRVHLFNQPPKCNRRYLYMKFILNWLWRVMASNIRTTTATSKAFLFTGMHLFHSILFVIHCDRQMELVLAFIYVRHCVLYVYVFTLLWFCFLLLSSLSFSSVPLFRIAFVLLDMEIWFLFFILTNTKERKTPTRKNCSLRVEHCNIHCIHSVALSRSKERNDKN